MKAKKRKEVEEFLIAQKAQLGLSEGEYQNLLQEAMQEVEEAEDLEFDASTEAEEGLFDLDETKEQLAAAPMAAAQQAPRTLQARTRVIAPPPKPEKRKRKRVAMSDPYLPESQTIQARPTKVSQFRSLLYEMALPNEYIVQVGVIDAKPVLGGKFFKLGKRFLKFPAAVQTVYFTSDNANKNYQGLKIDGYACWRVDPERPEVAAGTLDFTDQDNPMGNTNRILRTICTEAIRHIIANITIEEALTKKDEIGRDLKAQLERIERTWGVIFDQVGIERVTILSATVFDDLQQKTRDSLRLTAAESRMETDRDIEKRSAEHTAEIERLQAETEKEARILKAATESEVHKVELDEKARREAEERRAAEESRQAEAEAQERSAISQAEQAKRQTTRQAEVQAHKETENRQLALMRSASEAEIRIRSAESEAHVVEAQVKSDLIRFRAEHQRKMIEQELQHEFAAQVQAMEQDLTADRQAAELSRAAARFEQEQRERQTAAQVEHEVEIKELERLRLEEEVLNLVSENRVRSEFIEKLPEVASSLKIDRYTVLDGSGNSPLAHTLSQLISLLEAHGLDRLLGKEENLRDRAESSKTR